MPPETPDRSQRLLYMEVWSDIRPYVRFILSDFLVSALVWALYWLGFQLKKLLFVPSWSADVVAFVHAVGAITFVVIFVGLTVDDILTTRLSRRK